MNQDLFFGSLNIQNTYKQKYFCWLIFEVIATHTTLRELGCKKHNTLDYVQASAPRNTYVTAYLQKFVYNGLYYMKTLP